MHGGIEILLFSIVQQYEKETVFEGGQHGGHRIADVPAATRRTAAWIYAPARGSERNFPFGQYADELTGVLTTLERLDLAMARSW